MAFDANHEEQVAGSVRRMPLPSLSGEEGDAVKRAKFQCRQCVVWIGSQQVTRILRVGLVDSENKPIYWVQDGSGYVPEKYLRPLTAREIGQRPKRRGRK